MTFRTAAKVPIELAAIIKTHNAAPECWHARTIEVSRDELWVCCDSSQWIQAPQRGESLTVTFELPVNEDPRRRCMECNTELLAIETIDVCTVRLRFTVLAMKVRQCPSDNGAVAIAAKLVM